MVKYELKKVFSKSKNRVVLVMLIIVSLILCIVTVNRIRYTTPEGQTKTGILATKKLREDRTKWKGPLTIERLQEVVKLNDEINNSEEYLTDSNESQNKMYAQKQEFEEISSIINEAFSEWGEYDPYAIDSVTTDEVATLYERRVTNLENWLESGEEHFSPNKKAYLIQQYSELKVPFVYNYSAGWSALLQTISTLFLIVALGIGFFVSGIFSDEFNSKADSIFFSTKYGRSKAVLSKIITGFIIITTTFFAIMTLYTIICILFLGIDGWNSPLQLDMWRSTYNITFLQAYCLMVTGAYIGTLFASCLSMMVSALSRSTPSAIIVPFVVLCVFPFLSRIITLPQVCSLLPDQLLEIYITLRDVTLIDVGGRVFSTVSVCLALYSVLSMMMIPVLYRVYRKSELH